eukprot:comp22974_c0_seq1/m.36531 comp22974_c0_seq1/g.36531  ORF comp22974_c0_seq1/g.36531 comp22974_c0_seq1/m.36531 type:complete len:446 (-) comp22974_c0_seq1:960-2297(-)
MFRALLSSRGTIDPRFLRAAGDVTRTTAVSFWTRNVVRRGYTTGPGKKDEECIDCGGPEPVYTAKAVGSALWKSDKHFHCELGGVLKELQIAYETWGEMNNEKDNIVVLYPAMSASSHAAKSALDPTEGWWEKFVGPGKVIDTNKFFVICANSLGSCYGSTGPSSTDPTTCKPYATTFPIITISDMVNANFRLLDHLGIDSVYAVVGASLGGMQSLAAGALFPERVHRVVSISAAARSHPSSIALRYAQRKALMRDPNWNNGFYYGGDYPLEGMRNSRIIGTIAYRSAPEWEQRFGNRRVSTNAPHCFQADYLVEQYLEEQADLGAMRYDPNSMLYVTKAMDMFDLGRGFDSLEDGLARIKAPTLILGVQSDILIPCWQQKEIAMKMKMGGHKAVTFYELDTIYGHDTFLLDVRNVGAAVKGHLEHGVTKDRTGHHHAKDKMFDD